MEGCQEGVGGVVAYHLEMHRSEAATNEHGEDHLVRLVPFRHLEEDFPRILAKSTPVCRKGQGSPCVLVNYPSKAAGSPSAIAHMVGTGG